MEDLKDVNISRENEKYKVTVIIPCYNAEEFIKYCLLSILKQIPHDWELLVIDDGSTDKSLDIIKDIFSSEINKKNLKFIEKKNSGVSDTRNFGISIAKGDYIALIDADDIVEDNYVEELSKALDFEADIIEFNALQFSFFTEENNEFIKASSFDGFNRINSAVQLNNVFENAKWYPWLRLYKRNLFIQKNILFHPGIIYEDMLTIPMLYMNSKSIFNINKKLYKYRHNRKSLTNTFRIKDIHDLIHITEILTEYAKTNSGFKSLIFKTVKRNFNLIKQLIITRLKRLRQNLKKLLRKFFYHVLAVLLKQRLKLTCETSFCGA